jgi:hypothetical protein
MTWCLIKHRDIFTYILFTFPLATDVIFLLNGAVTSLHTPTDWSPYVKYFILHPDVIVKLEILGQ